MGKTRLIGLALTNLFSSTAVYDRAWWRRYNADLGAGTYTTQEFLYVEEPAVAACEPGALACFSLSDY